MKGDVLTCPVCGAGFIAKSKSHKYCSKECAEYKLLRDKEEKNRDVFAIFERDDFTCCYCGRSSIEDNVLLVIEHVIPRYSGGNNSMFNLVTSCFYCNTMKGASWLRKDVVKRILRRNIKRNKGISSEKRAEIKKLLMNRFDNCSQSESMVRYLR